LPVRRETINSHALIFTVGPHWWWWGFAIKKGLELVYPRGRREVWAFILCMGDKKGEQDKNGRASVITT
jgi:hypothetical protein